MPYREPGKIFAIDEVLTKKMERALKIAYKAYVSEERNLYTSQNMGIVISSLAIKIFDMLPNDEE